MSGASNFDLVDKITQKKVTQAEEEELKK